jgi:branched-chain amino acid transport system substrate-binding protein
MKTFRNGIGRGISLLIVMAAAVGTLTLGSGVISQPASAATKAPIVLGDICTCSGPQGGEAQVESGMLAAWAKWTNAHGGIAGHTVQIITKDDGENPSTATTDVEALVQQNHVVGLFDTSTEDPAFAAYIAKQKVPVFGDIANGTAAAETSPDFYPPGTTHTASILSEALALKTAHVKKVAQLYCSEVAVCASSVSEFKAALAKYGIKLVYTTGISFSAPNYTAQCLAAKQAGATGVFVVDASTVVTKVATNCAQQSYKPTELGAFGTVAATWLTAPGMEGNIDVQSDYPWFVHNGVTKDMYSAINKYNPSILTNASFGPIAVQAWVLGVEAKAAGEAGRLGATPTAAAFTKGLESFKGNTLGGLAPPLTFAKGKAHPVPCVFLMGIKNEKFVVLNGGKYECVG